MVPVAGRALDVNLARVFLDDAVGDRQTEARAAAVPVLGLFLVVKNGS